MYVFQRFYFSLTLLSIISFGRKIAGLKLQKRAHNKKIFTSALRLQDLTVYIMLFMSYVNIFEWRYVNFSLLYIWRLSFACSQCNKITVPSCTSETYCSQEGSKYFMIIPNAYPWVVTIRHLISPNIKLTHCLICLITFYLLLAARKRKIIREKN